jgi:hypothetical protein
MAAIPLERLVSTMVATAGHLNRPNITLHTTPGKAPRAYELRRSLDGK